MAAAATVRRPLAQVYALLASITSDDRIRGVTEPVYRPEAYAFGGDQAMTVAHTLFHVDSRHILGYLATAGGTHRREIGVLLTTRLMRAAGLEFSEQGDVWRLLATRRRQPNAQRRAPADRGFAAPAHRCRRHAPKPSGHHPGLPASTQAGGRGPRFPRPAWRADPRPARGNDPPHPVSVQPARHLRRRHLAARDGSRARHLPPPVRHPNRLPACRNDRQ
ncbi:thiopeptide-type bacteriocin biosynthesis protein [Micromonospora echinofusca]|uniref:thiopeptide-type bacteriocin biosynthesis protein n=1 Tax=Micromonospora echinofusca TaxID=47858 RepID=UPI0027DE4D99|nr:thiopeptide-type bacteriocin biosynthesis protein [Micromonospora echinofusca]